MFNIINPFFLVKKFTKMSREVSNFYFFKKQIKIISESSKGSIFNLKINYKGELYTAINLEPELRMYHTGKELEGIEKTYVGSRLAQFNEMFTEHEILEMVKLRWKRVFDNDYYAYIVHIKFRWKETSVAWILWYILYIGAIIILYPYVRDYIASFFTDK